MINGVQYTKAQEDLMLQGAKSNFKKAIVAEIQRGMREAVQTGAFIVDADVVFTHFRNVYVVGLIGSELREKKPGRRAVERLLGLQNDAIVAIHSATMSALNSGTHEVDLSEPCALLEQAYYMGREDGAGC